MIIHGYSRADALTDGTLIDISATAAEAGLTIPTAVTREVWESCVAWDEADNARKGTLQDADGRLWDVVWMTALAVRRHRGSDRARVQLVRTPRPGRARKAQPVQLEVVIGPGDHAEPVLTIQFPGQD